MRLSLTVPGVPLAVTGDAVALPHFRGITAGLRLQFVVRGPALVEARSW